MEAYEGVVHTLSSLLLYSPSAVGRAGDGAGALIPEGPGASGEARRRVPIKRGGRSTHIKILCSKQYTIQYTVQHH